MFIVRIALWPLNQNHNRTPQNHTLTNEVLRTEVAKAELKLEGNEQYVLEVKEQNQAVNADNKALNQIVSELNRMLAGCEAAIKGNEKLIGQLESKTK